MSSIFDIASQTQAGVLDGVSDYATISADGTLVAFESVTAGLLQAYVKNETTGVQTEVSTSTGGVASNSRIYSPTISADGSTVGFDTFATNLVSGVTGGLDEVYVKTLATGGLSLVSQTAGGIVANGESEDATLSANGNLVGFDSSASNLGLGAAGPFNEVYIKNMSTGGLVLASQTSTGTIANNGAFSTSISADGNEIVFYSNATDLGSSSGSYEVYSKNIATGALTIVSQTAAGTIANGVSESGSSSADGSEVAFYSSATNLVAGATSGNNEVYVKNLATGALTLVSSKADGTIANGSSSNPIISADGKYVMFQSTATNLVPNATSGTQQVYVKNLQTGAIALLSQDATGTAGNANSSTGMSFVVGNAFSADDGRTAFNTFATNLAATGGTDEVLRDTTTGPALGFNPVTSDDILNSNELAAPVTFSGTSSAIGGSVQVSIDTAGNSIGTATVQPDGTWSLTANVAGLAQGTHSEIATAQGAAYLTTTASQSFQVDTTAPTVAFTPGVTFNRSGAATISGTVSDPSSTVTNVEVFDNGNDLGAATLNGDGTWTLAHVALGHGSQNLTATGTDSVGNTSAQTPALYSLQTGIRGAPYANDEEDFNAAGQLTGEFFTGRRGRLYLADTVTNLPNGDFDFAYLGGSYFDTQNFYFKDDLYGPQFGLKVETLYNDDGTTSVTGFKNGQTLNSVFDDTMTGGGTRETFQFNPHFGQDTITDFNLSGPGHDFISLSHSQFSSIAQILAHTSDVNGNAVIHVGPRATITVDNVTTADLQAHHQDFKFHA